MPDLTALPAMPGGKPKQAPPPVQLVSAPASAERARPALNQAPPADGAAAGAPGSAPARDTGSAAVPSEAIGSLRPEAGPSAGSGVAAAGRGAGGAPASNGGALQAGGAAALAPHAGSHDHAGQQVSGHPATYQEPENSYCLRGIHVNPPTWLAPALHLPRFAVFQIPKFHRCGDNCLMCMETS